MIRALAVVLVTASMSFAATVPDPTTDGKMLVSSGGKYVEVTSGASLPNGTTVGDTWRWDGTKWITGPVSFVMNAASDIKYQGKNLVDTLNADIAKKQDKLSLKTINGVSIVGTGDITITCTAK